MSEQPVVSVLMSAFNNMAFLPEAISSILAQTFADFEFIIIDDGSTDATWNILTSCSDPRIRLVRNERNLGLARSLNNGLDLARGQYVTRQDADDISLPHRLERQIGLMEEHPDIGIVGSQCMMIDAKGRDQGILPKPLSDLEIRWVMLLDNPFAHPTVMVRRRILQQHALKYDEQFQTAQDYELWTRLLDFTRGANCDEALVKYRTGCTQVTQTRRQAQLDNHDAIALRAIRQHLPDFTISAEQVSQLRALFIGGEVARDLDQQRVQAAGLYFALLRAFVRQRPDAPGLKTLQGREALKLARVICRRPLRPGWAKLFLQVLSTSPGWPLALWIYMGKRPPLAWKRSQRIGIW